MDWSDKLVEKKNIKVDVETIEKGLIKDLSVYGFAVLMVLKAYENNGQELTQGKIAELTGISRKKVNEVIKMLSDEGFHEFPKAKKSKPKVSAKKYLELFMAEYYKKYGDKYPVNWGKDTALIKRKVTDVYKEEDLQEIIEMAFKLYDKIGNTKQYPRLTIGAFCSFVAERSYTEIIKARRNAPKRIQETNSKKNDMF